MPVAGTLESILETENARLQKLNDIVLKSIEEEKLISKNFMNLKNQHPGCPAALLM